MKIRRNFKLHFLSMILKFYKLILFLFYLPWVIKGAFFRGFSIKVYILRFAKLANLYHLRQTYYYFLWKIVCLKYYKIIWVIWPEKKARRTVFYGSGDSENPSKKYINKLFILFYHVLKPVFISEMNRIRIRN